MLRCLVALWTLVRFLFLSWCCNWYFFFSFSFFKICFGSQLRICVKVGGGRPGLPVPNSLYALCGRKATLNLSLSMKSTTVEHSYQLPPHPNEPLTAQLWISDVKTTVGSTSKRSSTGRQANEQRKKHTRAKQLYRLTETLSRPWWV